MKFINKKIIFVIVIIAFIFTINGCGKTNKDKAEVNFLTGETISDSKYKSTRPVAVMINNLKAALPQYGIDKADIIFEIPVEGGITRMMGIYSDYKNVPDICPIRSCRYYFPIFASGFDAIYVHWGSNDYANKILNELNIDRFNGLSYGSSLFGRDTDRLGKYALEHTGYLKGESLESEIKREGYRTTVLDEYGKTIFNFDDNKDNEEKESITDKVKDVFSSNKDEVIETVKLKGCNKGIINFSDEYYSKFVYDSKNKVYKKYHCEEAQVDGKSGNQLAFKNVFILETDITPLGIKELKKVNWNGGEGYYLSDGNMMRIKWSKESETSKIKITTLNGNEIALNKGKSYFGITEKNKTKLTLNDNLTNKDIYKYSDALEK